MFTHCSLTPPSSVAVFVNGTESKLWEVPTASFTSSANLSESLWEQDCQHSHLQEGARITADTPPRLDGTWVSTRRVLLHPLPRVHRTVVTYVTFVLSCCCHEVPKQGLTVDC